jgi:hypothetical protein
MRAWTFAHVVLGRWGEEGCTRPTFGLARHLHDPLIRRERPRLQAALESEWEHLPAYPSTVTRSPAGQRICVGIIVHPDETPHGRADRSAAGTIRDWITLHFPIDTSELGIFRDFAPHYERADDHGMVLKVVRKQGERAEPAGPVDPGLDAPGDAAPTYHHPRAVEETVSGAGLVVVIVPVRSHSDQGTEPEPHRDVEDAFVARREAIDAEREAWAQEMMENSVLFVDWSRIRRARPQLLKEVEELLFHRRYPNWMTSRPEYRRVCAGIVVSRDELPQGVVDASASASIRKWILDHTRICSEFLGVFQVHDPNHREADSNGMVLKIILKEPVWKDDPEVAEDDDW